MKNQIKSLLLIICLLSIIIIFNGCAALTPHTGWDAVLADINNYQPQYANQSSSGNKQSQSTQQQTVQSQSSYKQQTSNNNSISFKKESDAKQIENEGASLARQTSDYSKAQSIRSAANSLASRVRNGEISLEQAQAQLRGSQAQQNNQAQQSIQVAGWYYTNPQYGNSTKTTIYLMLGQRYQGNGRDCYNIIGIKNNGVWQDTSGYVGCYNSNNGLYVCQYNSYTIYFNM